MFIVDTNDTVSHAEGTRAIEDSFLSFPETVQFTLSSIVK